MSSRVMKPPPATLQFRFCPVCGHDNVVRPLRDRHYVSGKLCPGAPIKLTYRLALREQP